MGEQLPNGNSFPPFARKLWKVILRRVIELKLTLVVKRHQRGHRNRFRDGPQKIHGFRVLRRAEELGVRFSTMLDVHHRSRDLASARGFREHVLGSRPTVLFHGGHQRPGEQSAKSQLQ
jgi:hypothetical protein